MVTFSADECKVTVGSSRYKAVDGLIGKCRACTFKSGFGCHLVEEVWRTTPGALLLVGVSRCSPAHRQDGRSITWVLDI